MKNKTDLESRLFLITQVLEETIYLNDVLNFTTEMGYSDLSEKETVIEQVQRNARVTEKLLKEIEKQFRKLEEEIAKKQ